MNNNGYTQGYFIGVFFKFLWLLFLASIMQFMFVYIFGSNFVTTIILSIIFSFFINTSLPINNSYPFFRHILINVCVYIVQAYLLINLLTFLYEFYQPSKLWVILILISFLFGVLQSFGRYNNGTISKKIESIGNIVLFVFLISSGFLFWWHGTIMFIIFRIILISLEVWTANLITGLFIRKSIQNTNEYVDY